MSVAPQLRTFFLRTDKSRSSMLTKNDMSSRRRRLEWEGLSSFACNQADINIGSIYGSSAIENPHQRLPRWIRKECRNSNFCSLAILTLNISASEDEYLRLNGQYSVELELDFVLCHCFRVWLHLPLKPLPLWWDEAVVMSLVAHLRWRYFG